MLETDRLAAGRRQGVAMEAVGPTDLQRYPAGLEPLWRTCVEGSEISPANAVI